MKITILGCGASQGVPCIGNIWGKCDSCEVKNKRTRSSIFLENNGDKILFDTSFDLRSQFLRNNLCYIDGVVWTHGHADHVSGLPDLKQIFNLTKKEIKGFVPQDIYDYFLDKFSFCLTNYKDVHKGFLHLEKISGSFFIKRTKIIPIQQQHGAGISWGYRIGNFVYSTDVSALSLEALETMKDCSLWIVGLTRYKNSRNHAGLEKIKDWKKIIRPQKTVLTHMSNDIDYKKITEELPKDIIPAYDGMVLSLGQVF